MRSDKTHGHKPRRHIKLLLFLTGLWIELLCPVLSVYPRSLPLPFSYSILRHTWIRRSFASSFLIPRLVPSSFPSPSFSLSFHRASCLSFRFLPSVCSPLERGLVAYHAGYLSPAFRRASCLRPPTRRPDALPYHSIKFSHCHGHGFSRAWETYVHAWSLVDGYEHGSRRVCEKRLNESACNKHS